MRKLYGNELEFEPKIFQHVSNVPFTDIMENVQFGKDTSYTFRSSSACLVQIPESANEKSSAKYLMNIRYVNYYIQPNGRYYPPVSKLVTFNKIVELNGKTTVSP